MSPNLKRKVRLAYNLVHKVVSSNKFFYLIIAIAVFQGLWYALVFHPVIFDEGHHVTATFFYVAHPNPFDIGAQGLNWDVLGEMARNVSYVFYYAMGVPLRLVSIFTGDYVIQVIALRLVMIGVFCTGLFLYRKALLVAGFSPLIANLALLSTILLPNIAPLPGVVNYDNVIFLLFAAGLYLSLKIIKSTDVNATRLLLLITVMLVAFLIKFTTALALFLPLIIYIAYDLYKRHGWGVGRLFTGSFKRLKTITKVILVMMILIGTGLVTERVGANYVLYRKDSPACERILSKDRCMSNYTYKRGVDFRAVKPVGWVAYDPFQYLSTYWFTGMINTNIRMPDKSALPIMKLLFYSAALFGTLLVVMNMQRLLKNKPFKLLIVGMLFFVSALFYSNYRAYVGLGQPVAISGRYLLPYLPIFGALALMSFSNVMSRRTKTVTVAVILPVVLVLMTQGGGVTTLILDQNTYWQDNSFSRNLNENTKKLIDPLIKQKLR